jgi:hypothetical protein
MDFRDSSGNPLTLIYPDELFDKYRVIDSEGNELKDFSKINPIILLIIDGRAPFSRCYEYFKGDIL